MTSEELMIALSKNRLNIPIDYLYTKLWSSWCQSVSAYIKPFSQCQTSLHPRVMVSPITRLPWRCSPGSCQPSINLSGDAPVIEESLPANTLHIIPKQYQRLLSHRVAICHTTATHPSSTHPGRGRKSVAHSFQTVLFCSTSFHYLAPSCSFFLSAPFPSKLARFTFQSLIWATYICY